MQRGNIDHQNLARIAYAAKMEQQHAEALYRPETSDRVGFATLEQAVSSPVSGFGMLSLTLDDLARKSGLRFYDASAADTGLFDPQLILFHGFYNPKTKPGARRLMRDRLVDATKNLLQKAKSASEMADQEYDVKVFVEGTTRSEGRAYVLNDADKIAFQTTGRDLNEYGLIVGADSFSRREVDNHTGLSLAQRLCSAAPAQLVRGYDPAELYKKLGDISRAWTTKHNNRYNNMPNGEDVKRAADAVLDNAQDSIYPHICNQEIGLYTTVKQHLSQVADKVPVALVICDVHHASSDTITECAKVDGFDTVAFVPKLHRRMT